ncbi:FAD-dependent oxidoreductase [Corallococcus praedator]|uniref:FAD-dependent oxidoreductase n=1 Tax=Corallococcus praedator TaxID=2316724 RepID=A0ABX9QGK7_9BACT|nr:MULTISPECIES: NAD(P)/FAD-dependent oxidoreductase [Corallococcus]RKH35066.1 FAD-dependent oxidoreductase [Corallococcus sp. CA031C]RKI07344.1 FAD-dependent oxidoreductase [Corallococcus praedator]
MSDTWYDVVVVGAGFGGLATALELCRRGARVALCEALNYPGGCASTFRRGGYGFESGATLFSGFEAHQLFGRWIREHSLDVTVDWLDPLVEMRAPGLRLPVHRDRARLIEDFSAMPGAPVEALRRFFQLQARVADALWPLFDDPDLLPPLSVTSLLRHAGRAWTYAPLTRWLGRPLGAVLAHHGLEHFTPLRVYLDALCQITVQCSAAEAEAPFAFAAMDYYWRGTGHVRGGIGRLATALVKAIQARGGQVLLANQVRAVTPVDGGWRVTARRGELLARHVVANVLPQGLRSLLDVPVGRLPRVDALAERVAGGWGAAMLYLVVRPPEGDSGSAHHLELVRKPGSAFTEGNHLFASVSGVADEGRARPGQRTVTVSTHVPLKKLAAMAPEAQAPYFTDLHARMREGLEALAPEWMGSVVHVMTGSPRTFQRFTLREGGAVGGVPRRAGLGNYRLLGPFQAQRGLWLVGDSVFPGQSTLATAVGGVRTAASIASAR